MAGRMATCQPKKRDSVPPVTRVPPRRKRMTNSPTIGTAPAMSVPTLVAKKASWFHGSR